MASENKLMLLNRAVANLSDDEVYVEIGTWRGLSLIGAAHGNAEARLYACDNFSQFGGSRAMLEDTIAEFIPNCEVNFYEMDFRKFLQLAPWRPARIGAYFYDAGHTFEEQVLAIEYVQSWLAEDAVVIIDDTNFPQVRAANKFVTASIPELIPVVRIPAPSNRSSGWWNGLEVYRFSPMQDQARLVSAGTAFAVRRFYWDSRVPTVISAPLKWRNRLQVRNHK